MRRTVTSGSLRVTAVRLPLAVSLHNVPAAPTATLFCAQRIECKPGPSDSASVFLELNGQWTLDQHWTPRLDTVAIRGRDGNQDPSSEWLEIRERYGNGHTT
jgi:hypothetical protein